MPKATTDSLPVSGLFAVAKPSGPTSMAVVETIKKLVGRSRLFVEQAKLDEMKEGKVKRSRKNRDAVKTGQGGTLDPLADGVLVIGVGKGTKQLQQFLSCTKEYTTTCLLGSETDSYDKEGAIVRRAPWRHVDQPMVEAALPPFRGDIEQTPPIFSALKMDGKPLYEYARAGIPLPRPIEKRPVRVDALELKAWLGNDHAFCPPTKALTVTEKENVEVALASVASNPSVADLPGVEEEQEEAQTATTAETSEDEAPTAFELSMTVSGGTYVRSIVHDLAHAVGSAGHVVTLTRTRQGRFALNPESTDETFGCVPWDVFERASKDVGDRDDEGWTEWEREVRARMEVVE